MKRARKDPWRLIRREFAKYFFGEGKTPWTYVEGKDVFMAHNIYSSVVITHLGNRVHRVIVFNDKGRRVFVVTSPRDVYTQATTALKDLAIVP
jgi:hypothetical protein